MSIDKIPEKKQTLIEKVKARRAERRKEKKEQEAYENFLSIFGSKEMKNKIEELKVSRDKVREALRKNNPLLPQDDGFNFGPA